MNNAIEIDNLRKNLSDLQAVRGIRLDMHQGEIFSLPATAVLQVVS